MPSDKRQARRVILVPHTHWDREWYFTTRQSKVLLLESFTVVLDELESGGLPCFVLDGQTSLLEDYLQNAPGEQDRIRSLVSSGKLHIGPWYSQTDQCVVGGESILRNLLYGIRDALDLWRRPRRFHFDGDVERITLADPGRRNALGFERMQSLTAHLRAIDTSASASVVVIDAEGPAFSAGHDLHELCGVDLEESRAIFDVCTNLMTTIHEIRQPVIAAVDGVATAAGCQLVASCDLAVATERSTFATPGVRIGLFCSTPMVPISRAGRA